MVSAEPFDFELSQKLIPNEPVKERSDVRLMVLYRDEGKIEERKFVDILDYLAEDECYVNNAKAHPECTHLKGYQPIYACMGETWAIPTSGIPFEEWMLKHLNLRFLQLYSPKEGRLNQVEMFEKEESWEEAYFVENPPNRPVACIGTTVLKALESFARFGTPGVSKLFISPGFEFKLTKKLMTNFHLPKESQLALTCAFGGTSFVMDVYQYAMRRGYRFSDLGDRMLIV